MAYTDITRTGVEFIGNEFQLYVSTETDINGAVRRGWKGPLNNDWSLPDTAYLDDKPMGPTAGEYAVLVTAEAFYWVQPDLRHYKRLDFRTGRVSDPIVIPLADGTSQGISHFDYATGRLVWMDTQLAFPRPMVRRYTHEGWSAGMDPDADRFLGESPTGDLYVVANTKSSIGPRLRVVDGVPTAMLSNAVNGQVKVSFGLWERYTPPVALPPPDSHEPLPPVDGPMEVPDFARQRRPVEVIVVDPYSTEPDPFDFYSNAAEWARAETDAVDRPAIFYTDARRPSAEMIGRARRELNRGRTVSLSWNCYPDASLTDDQVEDQITGGFDDAEAVGGAGFSWVPWLGLFRGPRLNANGDWEFAWSGQQALDIAAYAWSQCVANPQVTKVFVWAKRRGFDAPIDGVDVVPEFQQAVDLMRREPVPVVPPPPPPPPQRSWIVRFWEWLKARFR